MQAKNWSGASSKLDAAAGFAKSGQEKIMVEQMRLGVAQGSGNKQGMIKSIETLIDMNAPNAAGYKKALPGLYAATGQKAKALQMLKTAVDGGGGSADDNYQVAAASYEAKNYPDALKYGNKALSMAGAKPKEAYFAVLMSTYKDTGKEAELLAMIERVVLLYPKEQYWSQLFVRIQKDPAYKGDYKLDLFRLKLAAKMALTSKDKAEMASQAQYKGFSGEAITALTPMPGDLAAADAASAKAALASATTTKATDDAGLAKEEAAATASGRGGDIQRAADKYFGYGKYDKAIPLYTQALAKGIPDASVADYTRLHLGIAQLRSGKKPDAQATWATIKGDTSAVQFAKHWILVSKAY